MPNQRLIAIVTALLMLGGASKLYAAYTLDQLKEIERLVMLRDTSALGAYLSANIGVTEGEDALSVELRKFLQCTRAGDLNCFDATRLPSVPKEPSQAAITIY
jgi:hypothetical protein